ncbi:hypothetical protein ACMD2_26188 [Ananas comosus]|uniref:EF-hand domain-containing protein n=1 Tax=Ananas comosus TaxID=4615 RepID=A0A199UZ50_ANACO|nr:hypothetical protein ACMD2_26188 [Ananas comosus]
MAMELIDGKIVADFIADAAAFNRAADEFFAALDVDGDGRLCRSELFTASTASSATGSRPNYLNRRGKTLPEFRFRLRELMAAVPVQIALYEDRIAVRRGIPVRAVESFSGSFTSRSS